MFAQGAHEGAPQTRQIADRFHILQNLCEAVQATMRRLAMRFISMLKSKSVGELIAWLRDAQKSGLYAMKRFARTEQRDIEAVRNAITEPWSTGHTEGQINRLKALKRTMYG